MMKTKKVIRLVITICFSIFINLVHAQVNQKTLNDHKRRWDTPAWTDTLKNPFSNNLAAIDSGKVLYKKICIVCHGDKGKGDGIAAPGLAIKPADHTSPNVQMQTDGSLFYELSYGHSPMPAFKTVLTEKQNWLLICYIRSLKGTKATSKMHSKK